MPKQGLESRDGPLVRNEFRVQTPRRANHDFLRDAPHEVPLKLGQRASERLSIALQGFVKTEAGSSKFSKAFPMQPAENSLRRRRPGRSSTPDSRLPPAPFNSPNNPLDSENLPRSASFRASEPLLREFLDEGSGQSRNKKRRDVEGTPLGEESTERAQGRLRNSDPRIDGACPWDGPDGSHGSLRGFQKSQSKTLPACLDILLINIASQDLLRFAVAFGSGGVDFSVDCRLNIMPLGPTLHFLLDCGIVMIMPDPDEFKQFSKAIEANICDACHNSDNHLPWTGPTDFDKRMPRKGWTFRLVGRRADDAFRIKRHGLEVDTTTGRLRPHSDFETFCLNEDPLVEFTSPTSPAFVFGNFFQQFHLSKKRARDGEERLSVEVPSWWLTHPKIGPVVKDMTKLAHKLDQFEPREGVVKRMRTLNVRELYSSGEDPKKRFRSWKGNPTVTYGDLFGTSAEGGLAGGVRGSPAAVFNPPLPSNIYDDKNYDTDQEYNSGDDDDV
ncbi:hypothetical protein BKA70DRAFT_1226677 [Coprinopsis sp. MPI-PUGE-AT-0042]|nr:hypothetical protein BKA70DRAFT_1226677 [Coprinopsis sp. MPI-PUGE-AT-0042]